MDALTKRDISEVYSISCVERYVLAYLKKMGINVSLLYCNSYLSVNHLIRDFVTNNETYANYGAISRIQNIAVELGILKLKGEKNPDLDFLLESNYEYLLEMKQKTFNKMYEKETWREDHFFYSKRIADDRYIYLNDIPLQEKVIDSDELTQLYNQRYLAFKYTDKQINQSNLFMRFCRQYEEESRFEHYLPEQIEYETLRDIICMLRISRKRVVDFISQWKEPNLEWVERVNNIFSKLEYSRVRKRYDSKIFMNEKDNFLRDEKEIGNYLQEIKSMQLQGGKKYE